MKSCERIKSGDFTALASMYAKYRPGYSESVLHAILGIVNKPKHEIAFADVGAGTGIWTRLVASEGCRSVVAIEPNDAMRTQGKIGNGELDIIWQSGSAENTHLNDESIDLLSMASSFHWTDFELATKEFHRILKPNGYFVTLWNPRFLENNPLLLNIEEYIYQLEPAVKRLSSGKSGYVDDLINKLSACPYFSDLTYIENKHTITLKIEDYVGIWQSVNDVRVQLGETKFAKFIDYIHEKLDPFQTIDCSYQTRAWIMKRK